MKKRQRVVDVNFSSITNENGDLQISRDSFFLPVHNTQYQVNQDQEVLQRPMYVPTQIYEPLNPVHINNKLGTLGWIGLQMVRLLGADTITLWFPLLVAIATLGVILVFARW
jgi:hypothetical protein